MRVDAKYCSRACKTNEGKYKRRKKQFIENCKSNEMKNVELIKYIKEIVKNNTF
jgi:DNA-binding transcriptional regulator YhcF (GntR family)